MINRDLVNSLRQEVEIPFMEQFREPLLDGRKTMTSRTRKYANVHDTFRAFGGQFQILSVGRYALNFIAQNFWANEGVSSPGEFMQVWSKLHRGVWNPNRLVWVHEFRRIQLEGGDPLPSFERIMTK